MNLNMARFFGHENVPGKRAHILYDSGPFSNAKINKIGPFCKSNFVARKLPKKPSARRKLWDLVLYLLGAPELETEGSERSLASPWKPRSEMLHGMRPGPLPEAPGPELAQKSPIVQRN